MATPPSRTTLTSCASTAPLASRSKRPTRASYVAPRPIHAPPSALTPASRLTQAYIDYLANPKDEAFAAVDPTIANVPASDTLADKNIEKTFIGVSKEGYKKHVWPGTACMRRLGNCYTASLYACLASLVDDQGASLQGKRAAMFSYGSGLAASFFAVHFKGDPSNIKQKLDLQNRFNNMQVRPCKEFSESLEVRGARALPHRTHLPVC